MPPASRCIQHTIALYMSQSEQTHFKSGLRAGRSSILLYFFLIKGSKISTGKKQKPHCESAPHDLRAAVRLLKSRCSADLPSLYNKRGGRNPVCKWLCWLVSLLLNVPPPIGLIFLLDTSRHTYNYSTKCTCSVSLSSSNLFCSLSGPSRGIQ